MQGGADDVGACAEQLAGGVVDRPDDATAVYHDHADGQRVDGQRAQPLCWTRDAGRDGSLGGSPAAGGIGHLAGR